MVPIIGTTEAREQRTVLGPSQPTRSITEVCAYNMRSPPPTPTPSRMKRVQVSKTCGLCGVKVTSPQQPTLKVATVFAPFLPDLQL